MVHPLWKTGVSYIVKHTIVTHDSLISHILPNVPVIRLSSSVSTSHCLLCDNGDECYKYFSSARWHNGKLLVEGSGNNEERKGFFLSGSSVLLISGSSSAHSFFGFVLFALPSGQSICTAPSHGWLHPAFHLKVL